MSELTLFVKVDRLDGALTTFVDAAVELRQRGVNVKLFVLVTRYAPTLREAMDEFTPGHNARVLLWSTTLMNSLLTATRGNVIVSANIMAQMAQNYKNLSRIFVLYPRLVDDGDWTVQQFRDALRTTHGVVIGNMVNQKLLDMHDRYVYWQVGLGRNRINALRARTATENAALTSTEYASTYFENQRPTAFTHSVYEYSRLGRLGQGGFENIGKMLFEFLLTGRRVLYSAAGKVMDDGLTEMLALFNVDDNVDQELCISVVDLELVFFDKPYDELYALLSRMR